MIFVNGYYIINIRFFRRGRRFAENSEGGKAKGENMLNSLLISGGAIAAIVIVAVVLIAVIAIVVWWIKTANALVRLNNKAEEAWATIDVFLKKRSDPEPCGNRERLCKTRKRNAYQRGGGA